MTSFLIGFTFTKSFNWKGCEKEKMCGKNGLKVLNPNPSQLYYKISKIEK